VPIRRAIQYLNNMACRLTRHVLRPPYTRCMLCVVLRLRAFKVQFEITMSSAVSFSMMTHCKVAHE